jgi:hypothetical protein
MKNPDIVVVKNKQGYTNSPTNGAGTEIIVKKQKTLIFDVTG